MNIRLPSLQTYRMSNNFYLNVILQLLIVFSSISLLLQPIPAT